MSSSAGPNGLGPIVPLQYYYLENEDFVLPHSNFARKTRSRWHRDLVPHGLPEQQFFVSKWVRSDVAAAEEAEAAAAPPPAAGPPPAEAEPNGDVKEGDATTEEADERESAGKREERTEAGEEDAEEERGGEGGRGDESPASKRSRGDDFSS